MARKFVIDPEAATQLSRLIDALGAVHEDPSPQQRLLPMSDFSRIEGLNLALDMFKDRDAAYADEIVNVADTFAKFIADGTVPSQQPPSAPEVYAALLKDQFDQLQHSHHVDCGPNYKSFLDRVRPEHDAPEVTDKPATQEITRPATAVDALAEVERRLQLELTDSDHRISFALAYIQTFRAGKARVLTEEYTGDKI